MNMVLLHAACTSLVLVDCQVSRVRQTVDAPRTGMSGWVGSLVVGGVLSHYLLQVRLPNLTDD